MAFLVLSFSKSSGSGCASESVHDLLAGSTFLRHSPPLSLVPALHTGGAGVDLRAGALGGGGNQVEASWESVVNAG